MSTEASTAVEGTCEKVPAHLKIKVLVAEAGKYAGQSQMEISGVRMRYAVYHDNIYAKTMSI